MFSAANEENAKILVSKQPTKSIFKDPKIELCRNIDIARGAAFVSSLLSPHRTYIDALEGTSVRAVRVAKEVRLCNTNKWAAYQIPMNFW